MRSFIERFTSRKFLMSLVPVIAGLLIAFGVEGSEIVELVSTVVGLTTTLLGALGFCTTEAKVDAAKKTEE